VFGDKGLRDEVARGAGVNEEVCRMTEQGTLESKELGAGSGAGVSMSAEE
jgi:hypothetical protein